MFEARYVEATQHENGSVSYRRPFYAEVLFPTPEQAALLRELGYRFVWGDPSMRRSFYARPWPLWAVLRLHQKMCRAFWETLKILYWWGAIHKVTPPGRATRLRDLRLGPGRE